MESREGDTSTNTTSSVEGDGIWDNFMHPVLSDIDGSIAHILGQIAVTPKQSTIEALVEAIDADDDDILHARYVLFKHAIDRYHDQLYLMLGEEAEKPKLILKNRKGSNATTALSRDVYALFLYVSGSDACFPKGVLSAKCNLIEIKSTSTRPVTPMVATVNNNDDRPTNTEDTAKLHETAQHDNSNDTNKSSPIIKTDKLRVLERLAHVTSVCRDLQSQLQNERTERKNIFGILENRITSLEMKLSSYSEIPKQDSGDRPGDDNDVTTDVICSATGNTPPPERAVGSDPGPRQPRVSLTEFPALPDVSTSTPKSQHHTPTANGEHASHETRANDLSIMTAVSVINHENDNSSSSNKNCTTNNSKICSNRSSSSNIKSSNNDTSDKSTSSSSSSSITSSTDHPTTNTGPSDNRSYSEVSQIQGPWLTPKRELKKLKKKKRNEDLLETRNRQSSPVLKAAKLESGVTLYIQNIHMPEGCDKLGVLNMVKKYANRDDDPTAAIRIKKGTVISNHRCDDVVGCRIVVSENDAKKSIQPGYWPDGMTCRRWEDRPPRRGMQQVRYRRHETQELRPSRIFYRQNIGDYDRDDRHYAGTTRRTADNKDNKNPDNLQRRDRLDKDDGDNGRDRCVDFNDFQYSRISSAW